MNRGNLLLWAFGIAWVPCRGVGALPSEKASPRPAIAAVRSSGADTVPACCTIVRIDTLRSRATARELATGFTFVFEVKSRRQLRSLKVGRSVWADFARRTVRLTADAPQPCCVILSSP